MERGANKDARPHLLLLRRLVGVGCSLPFVLEGPPAGCRCLKACGGRASPVVSVSASFRLLTPSTPTLATTIQMQVL